MRRGWAGRLYDCNKLRYRGHKVAATAAAQPAATQPTTAAPLFAKHLASAAGADRSVARPAVA